MSRLQRIERAVGSVHLGDDAGIIIDSEGVYTREPGDEDQYRCLICDPQLNLDALPSWRNVQFSITLSGMSQALLAPMSRAEIGQQRRQRNLARALQAITGKVAASEGGLPACSMADLVDSSSLSRGSFYSYFKNRSSVAHSLATFASLTVELQTERKQAEISRPLERLALSYHAYLAFALDHGPLAIVMIDDYVARFPGIRTYLPEPMASEDHPLRAAVDAGDLSPTSLSEATRDVVSGGLALSMKRLACGFPASEDWLTDTASRLLMAVGAEAQSAAPASDRARAAFRNHQEWPVEEAALAAAGHLDIDHSKKLAS